MLKTSNFRNVSRVVRFKNSSSSIFFVKELDCFWIFHHNAVLIHQHRTKYDQIFVFVTVLE